VPTNPIHTHRLPGASADSPNRYPFGTSYADILADLQAKDPALYTRNGLIEMMRRDAALKPRPQRWQDYAGPERFDVVLAFERRVWEAVVAHLNTKLDASHPTLVLNMNVRDSLADAAEAAPRALQLCQMLEETGDWEGEVETVLKRFQKETGVAVTYTVCWS
jgi:RNA polymerase II subunit A C-terminal domain phosphatase SSU72